MNDFSNLKGLQILVVDDDTDTLELMTIVLEQYEARVTAVASVGAALDVIRQSQPDILVSDIAMPQADGYDLIRQVRMVEAEQGGFLPAIALTAYAGDAERTRTLEAGFQRHVSKPVDPIDLVTVVAELARSLG